MLMEMGESTRYQQHVFLYAFRSGPMLARTHTHISLCPHPESMLFRNLGHRFAWTLTIYFPGTKIRTTSPSCVLCFPLPHALGTSVHQLDLPTIAAVQRYASRNRCVVWHQEGSCPVNAGSIRERRGNMTPRQQKLRRACCPTNDSGNASPNNQTLLILHISLREPQQRRPANQNTCACV